MKSSSSFDCISASLTFILFSGFSALAVMRAVVILHFIFLTHHYRRRPMPQVLQADTKDPSKTASKQVMKSLCQGTYNVQKINCKQI